MSGETFAALVEVFDERLAETGVVLVPTLHVRLEHFHEGQRRHLEYSKTLCTQGLKKAHTYNYLHIIVHSVGVVLYEIHGRHESCIFPIHTVEILSQHRVLLDLNALLVFLEPAQRPDYRVPRQPRQLREVCRELAS